MKRAPVALALALALAALLTCSLGCEHLSLDQGLQIAQAAKSTAKAIIPISTDEEIQIGQAVAARVAGRYRLSTDTALNRYVSLVGRVAGANAGRADLAWSFAVLDSDEVNAFAAPGGYVFVTRGAVKAMDNEAQLAGVLSHEIAHVSRKHILKAIQKANLAEAGKSLAAASGKIPAEVLNKAADTGSEMLFKGYSRGDEYDADAEGTRILWRSGYPGDGLVAFLGRLASGKAPKGSLAVLGSTHPETTERIERVKSLIKSESLSGAGRPDLADRFHKNAG